MSNANRQLHSAENTKRPPVVAIMGHVDHGKSTLLDTIRKTNVVAGEAGGITQHVAAYEVEHDTADGLHKITFIDTPGHAAFQNIRQTSAHIADIAILIVAVDDGVKPQTVEAWNTIKNNNVPYLVALNKIDKSNADKEKTIRELLELGIYLEGYGGDISYVEISAKQGTGITDLLDTIILLAEFVELSYDPNKPATGFVVDSYIDNGLGVAATILIKDGSLDKSQFISCGRATASCRIVHDFQGKEIKTARASAPVTVFGFSSQCPVGETFQSFTDKESAECFAEGCDDELRWIDEVPPSEEMTVVPVIVKCDVVGSIRAVISEIRRYSTDRIFFKIVHAGIGDVCESDLQKIMRDEEPIIIAFNVNVDRQAQEMDISKKVIIEKCSVIYRIGEFLAEIVENRKFRKQVESVRGTGQVLKIFSQDKNQILVGIRVSSGEFKVKDIIRIVRNRETIAKGKVVSIQVGKSNSIKVEQDNDCGMMVELSTLPRQFDIMEAITMIDG